MKVDGVQHDICWESPYQTDAPMAPMIAAAAASGARLVVLTEMVATGFSRASERIAQAPAGPSATVLADQAVAHGVWLAASVPTADPGLPRPVNRLVVSGPRGERHPPGLGGDRGRSARKHKCRELSPARSALISGGSPCRDAIYRARGTKRRIHFHRDIVPGWRIADLLLERTESLNGQKITIRSLRR